MGHGHAALRLAFARHLSPSCAMAATAEHHTLRLNVHKLARFALFGFILTFIIARAFVLMIMAHSIPNFYFFLQGTHVHHLNYGIALLATVGGYGVFRRPVGRPAEITALLYGVAMALTFDEFGMWLHLGGSYWQRTSVDAVIVVAALMALCAYMRSIEHFESKHRRATVILLVALAAFSWVIYSAGLRLGDVYGPRLHELEVSSSP
jgi:hypothetical protein